MSLRINNGQVVDPRESKVRKTDLFLREGKIVGIGSAPKGFKARQTIDATDHWILPGLIDCQARLRDPGEPEKANIESETEAAIRNRHPGVSVEVVPLEAAANAAAMELIGLSLPTTIAA